MNYREVHLKYTSGLAQILGDEREAQIDVRLLLEAACGTSLSAMLTEPDREVSDDEMRRLDAMMERRIKREPVAYILGEWSFMGLPFAVNRDVLIPRQDTETLVEEAMRVTPDKSRILDLCTGSGCILLSLLHYSNASTGLGTDLSAKALRTADENARRLGLSDRAAFAQGDLFEAVPKDEEFDLVISNPPYIVSDIITTLAPEVRLYEPLTALDGGADGLSFYRRIVQEAPSHLVIGGSLMMEIGYDQAEAVSDMMKEQGYYDVTVSRDYGGNCRVVHGIRSMHQ